MKDYSKIDKEVDVLSDTIWDMATNVWTFAEVGFAELKSSAYEAGVLAKSGFKISDRGIGGIDTAWIATWGKGSPTIGILVEFDALPGLGNEAVPTKTPRRDGNTNGHGPLHQWGCTACHGMSIGRKAVIQAAHVMADMALDLMREPKLLQAAKDEFAKRTDGKKYVSLNAEPAPPGGRLDYVQENNFDCVIHTVMKHFGIGGPGPIAGADALRD